jgi:hypothetical protein
LNETDENKVMQALLLKHPIVEAGNPSDRETDANQKPVMRDHGKTSLSNSKRTVTPFSAAA